MIINSDENEYVVREDILAETATYRIYLCEEVKTKQEHLLMISTTAAHNGSLSKMAFVLGELNKASAEYEVENARSSEKKIHYDWLFPMLKESFISTSQNGRRVLIVSFAGTNVANATSLSSIKHKAQRMSLETSAWVMGRLLKLIAFTQEICITGLHLLEDSVWVDLEDHHMVVLDWSEIIIFPGSVPSEACARDISLAAKIIFKALGGDVKTGLYRYDENHPYPKYLWQLATKNSGLGVQEHKQFYEFIHGLFGSGFRPSELLPL
jgi:hypothetical protein